VLKGRDFMKIGFIGAGKVSTALGKYFYDRGIQISGYYSRSCCSAQNASRLTNSAAPIYIHIVLKPKPRVWTIYR